MHPKLCARRLLLGIVALSLMTGGIAKAQPLDRSGSVIVPVGGAVRLQMKSKKLIKQVFNPNPDIVLVEADAANPAFVILRGQKQGATRLELTDADGAKESYEVVVQTDIELLRNILRRAVPTATVDVIPFGNGVVLSGYVARAEDVDSILRIAGTVLGSQNVVNAMTVGGVHQVQLDVTVARVDRNKLRQRGFAWAANGTTVSIGSIIGGLASSTGGSASTMAANGVGVVPSAAGFAPTSAGNIVFGIIPAQFQGVLQALKTEGLAKLLASPKLVTQSGRPAQFLSGGQQAILSASSGITGPGVTLYPIGTQLDFLPIVYGNGKIYLEVSPSVTAVNQALGIATTFGTVPGFDQQTMRTSVVMESGQTFAIGGLIQTSLQAQTVKVPILGELPFVGTLFSSQTTTEDEQELVILVTPWLVDPQDCNQVAKRLPGRESRSVDDFEFYLEGILEAPRGQRHVFENKHYKGAWKNDPAAAVFPCGMEPYGHYHGGNCASGSCTNGNALLKAPTVVNLAPTPNAAELPPAVTVPKDVPVPPKTGK